MEQRKTLRTGEGEMLHGVILSSVCLSTTKPVPPCFTLFSRMPAHGNGFGGLKWEKRTPLRRCRCHGRCRCGAGNGSVSSMWAARTRQGSQTLRSLPGPKNQEPGGAWKTPPGVEVRLVPPKCGQHPCWSYGMISLRLQYGYCRDQQPRNQHHHPGTCDPLGTWWRMHALLGPCS